MDMWCREDLGTGDARLTFSCHASSLQFLFRGFNEFRSSSTSPEILIFTDPLHGVSSLGKKKYSLPGRVVESNDTARANREWQAIEHFLEHNVVFSLTT